MSTWIQIPDWMRCCILNETLYENYKFLPGKIKQAMDLTGLPIFQAQLLVGS